MECQSLSPNDTGAAPTSVTCLVINSRGGFFDEEGLFSACTAAVCGTSHWPDLRSKAVWRHALAQHWTVSRRARVGGGWHSRRSQDLLLRRGCGWSMEVERWRRELEASVRSRKHLVDWRDRDCRFRPQCNLCRHRRGLYSRQYGIRRWRVQVSRWRADVEERRTARHPAHRCPDH